MSAFLLSHYHINVLVSYAALRDIRLPDFNANRPEWWKRPFRLRTAQDGQDLGLYLIAANVLAMQARYPKAHEASLDEHMKAYKHTLILSVTGPQFKPVDIIKATYCYDYQVCEMPGYDISVSAAIMRCIRDDATRALPGYSGAPWELTGPPGG
jgi:hypothetical protein